MTTTMIFPDDDPDNQSFTAAPAKMAELDREALALIERGAPGSSFAELHRRGWRPWSQRGVDREGRPLSGEERVD